MIQSLAEFSDPVDTGILELLRTNSNGCRIRALVVAIGKNEGAIRYRLLTLEAIGKVRAQRERGSTTYFLNTPERSI